MLAGPASAAVPSPPRNVTARAGHQLAEVTWDAPTADDPSITGYTITVSPLDAPAVTVDQAARTATVTGLTNGAAYTFTVAAINPDGTSPPSDPCAPVTPAPPAATSLTMAASPTSLLHGGTVILSGQLQRVDTAAGIAGETVALELRPRGATTWTTLTTVTTARDDSLDPTPQVTPQAHTEYRLRHPATPFYTASASPTVTVLVGVRLTARLSRTSMGPGPHRHHRRPGHPGPPRPAHPAPTQAGQDLANRPSQDAAEHRSLQLRRAAPGHRDQRMADLQGQRPRPYRRHQPDLAAGRLPGRDHRHPC